MQRTRPSRRGARDDARGKLGWWSNERRGEGGLVLDCGRTGIPAGVLPAIAPGSERPTRPILSESDKTKNNSTCSVVARVPINAFHLSKSPVLVWTSI